MTSISCKRFGSENTLHQCKKLNHISSHTFSADIPAIIRKDQIPDVDFKSEHTVEDAAIYSSFYSRRKERPFLLSCYQHVAAERFSHGTTSCAHKTTHTHTPWNTSFSPAEYTRTQNLNRFTSKGSSAASLHNVCAPRICLEHLFCEMRLSVMYDMKNIMLDWKIPHGSGSNRTCKFKTDSNMKLLLLNVSGVWWMAWYLSLRQLGKCNAAVITVWRGCDVLFFLLFSYCTCGSHVDLMAWAQNMMFKIINLINLINLYTKIVNNH